MINLSETLLRMTCKDPQATDSVPQPPSAHSAAAELLDVLPELSGKIAGRRILDFGCGTGEQAVGLALAGASVVCGLDINTSFLERGRTLAERHQVADRVRFVESMDDRGERFDLVLSYNSMEHFFDPLAALRTMATHMHHDTTLVVAFSPPWLSPYGAHMHYFTPIPWVHLLFPERTVLAVRSRYKSDGALRYEDIEGGLNKMTVGRFFRLVPQAGLVIEAKRLVAVRRLPLVTMIPGVREFFTVRVVAFMRLRS
jgi:SAM-dependent methyltransferase